MLGLSFIQEENIPEQLYQDKRENSAFTARYHLTEGMNVRGERSSASLCIPEQQLNLKDVIPQWTQSLDFQNRLWSKVRQRMLHILLRIHFQWVILSTISYRKGNVLFPQVAISVSEDSQGTVMTLRKANRSCLSA